MFFYQEANVSSANQLAVLPHLTVFIPGLIVQVQCKKSCSSSLRLYC